MTIETEEVIEQTEEQKQQEQKDAEAGFAAGYAKVSGKEPPKIEAEDGSTTTAPDKKEAKSVEDKGAAAKATAPVKDEWESVPKVVRDKFQSLEGLPNRLRNIEGHVGGLKTSIDSVIATAKAAATIKGADAPTDKQVQAAFSNPEAFKQLKEDFPDWAGPIEAEFASLRAEISKQPKPQAVDIDGLRKEVTGNTREAIDRGLEQAEERAFLRMKHPDWKTTINSNGCKAWMLSGGPSEEDFQKYRELQQTDPQKAAEVVHGFASAHPQWWGDRGAFIFSESADDAIKLLDGYEASKKQDVDAEAARLKKVKRLTGAVVPQGTPTPPTTGISDEDAFARGYKRVKGR